MTKVNGVVAQYSTPSNYFKNLSEKYLCLLPLVVDAIFLAGSSKATFPTSDKLFFPYEDKSFDNTWSG